MQASSSWSPPGGTLGTIIAETRARIESLRARAGALEAEAGNAGPAPSLANALSGTTLGVIAEVKRRSPSKGDINPRLDAAELAAAYASGGAAAISVLTEPGRFGGSEADLVRVRQRVTLPTLKKDFHLDPLQVLEAKALGASALLLIARALSPTQLETMARTARAAGIEYLVEVRDEWELERAMAVEATLIGVNSRDLETLAIDPATLERLLPLIPARCVAIAESGMTERGDVERAAAWGADAVLVGSSVSASSDPEGAVRGLTGVRRAARRG